MWSRASRIGLCPQSFQLETDIFHLLRQLAQTGEFFLIRPGLDQPGNFILRYPIPAAALGGEAVGEEHFFQPLGDKVQVGQGLLFDFGFALVLTSPAISSSATPYPLLRLAEKP